MSIEADRIRVWQVVALAPAAAGSKVPGGPVPRLVRGGMNRAEANELADRLNRAALERGEKPLYLTRYEWWKGRGR